MSYGIQIGYGTRYAKVSSVRYSNQDLQYKSESTKESDISRSLPCGLYSYRRSIPSSSAVTTESSSFVKKKSTLAVAIPFKSFEISKSL